MLDFRTTHPDTRPLLSTRSLFIIDKEGIVQHATINNLAFGRNVDETLRVLQVRRPP